MALGIKTKKGVEQGDIIQADETVIVYEDDGKTKYDNAIVGDRIGFATGQTVRIGWHNYIELVYISSILPNRTPNFSDKKLYIRSNADVSFKANPDYDYLSSGTNTNTNSNIWGQVGNILSGVLGIFAGNKTTGTGPTSDIDSPSGGAGNNAITTPEPQQSWLQKNAILVISGVVIVGTAVIVYAVGKKKDK